jgi:hypothetical protein
VDDRLITPRLGIASRFRQPALETPANAANSIAD